MSLTKNQHFVPRFYLCRFANENKQLCCWQKQSKKFFYSNPDNVGVKKYLYEEAWDDQMPESFGRFVQPNAIEDMFIDLEGEFASNLDSLICKCRLNKDNQNAIIGTASELMALEKMIANLIVRHPYQINNSAHEEEIDYLMKDEELATVDQAFGMWGFGSIKPAFHHVINMSNLDPQDKTGTAFHIANDLNAMNMNFYYSENGFITSDWPVQYRCTNNEFISAGLSIHPNIYVEYSNVSHPFRRNHIINLSKINEKFTHRLNMNHVRNENAKVLIANKKILIHQLIVS